MIIRFIYVSSEGKCVIRGQGVLWLARQDRTSEARLKLADALVIIPARRSET